MAISQISMNSVATNPAYTNPYAKTDQSAATAQGQMNQNAQKTTKQMRTDTVTLSQQAIQKSGQSQNGLTAMNQNRNQVQAQAQTQQQQQSQNQNQNRSQAAGATGQTPYQYPNMTRRSG